MCGLQPLKSMSKLADLSKKAIFNEDMVYAGHAVTAGYCIAYAAEAKVRHSHNYTCMQQFHRNFDLGVSQADHPEVFEVVSSEHEGAKLIKSTIRHLEKTKNGYRYHI